MFDFLATTLSRYLARFYFLNFIGLLFILMGIVYLFDTIELLRRAGRHDDIGITTVMVMGLLKLPEMANVIAPFTILFAGLYSFWQLSKRSELVVLRSAGISVWQFLFPIIVTSLIIGFVMVGIVNPLSATFYSQYSSMERKYLKRSDDNVVAVFKQGLWLRQENGANGYSIIHAEKVEPDWRLSDVIVFSFNSQNNFISRIDAPYAALKKGEWIFRDSVLNQPLALSRKTGEFRMPTNLTQHDIEESFSSPKSMGFWNMPSFVRTLHSTGFDSTRVRIHFQSLLSQPLLYAAMILLAACVALRQQRQGHSFLFVTIGVLTGFTIFLLSNFLQALGSSHQLPVFLAAWSPALISTLVGTTILLTLEDG